MRLLLAFALLLLCSLPAIVLARPNGSGTCFALATDLMRNMGPLGFTLFGGSNGWTLQPSGAATYTPGQPFRLNLVNVANAQAQWRGLLAYAVDSNGARVGTWTLDTANTNLRILESAGNVQCLPAASTLTHTSRADKPSGAQISTWTGQGISGPITFNVIVTETGLKAAIFSQTFQQQGAPVQTPGGNSGQPATTPQGGQPVTRVAART